MKAKLLYLFSFAAGLTLTGCPDPVCFNPDPTYSFNVSAYFTPEQDSIQVGDTLYLISEFPSTMVPVGGQDAVNYSNSTGIGSLLNVDELQPGAKEITGAVSNFDYFNISGQIYNSKDIPRPDGVQQLRYKEAAGKYQLKVGIIPKKKGIYSLVIGDGLSNGRTIEDKCTKATFSITVANLDPHMYYLDDFTDTPLEQIPNIHYLFRVY